ncbi:MAG: hypothetical protein QM758_02610 [Armatimonas sp.]
MTDPDTLIYDETGLLAILDALQSTRNSKSAVSEGAAESKASFLPLDSLNGSWYLQLMPMNGQEVPAEIRGALRIEVTEARLRMSGDIYVSWTPQELDTNTGFPPPITPTPLVIGDNWYPHFPFDEYAWYFRSTSAIYAGGKLTVAFDRRIWDSASPDLEPYEREFLPADNQMGVLVLECPAPSEFHDDRLPHSPTLRLTGEMILSGTRYRVAVTKSSRYHRGCRVVADRIGERPFPSVVTTCQGVELSYVQVFRDEASMDIDLDIRPTPLAEISKLIEDDLDEAQKKNGLPEPGKEAQWFIWVLIGSVGLKSFGKMFDDTAPQRQGLVVFFDNRFTKDPKLTQQAQGERLGNVPIALLRTLLHETSHAFNIVHSDDDVHYVPTGFTLMNQTSDIIARSSVSNQFPCSADFRFEEHQRTSLIHSPDPQVAPGWKQFPWGHSPNALGVLEPTDALGLTKPLPIASGLELKLMLPGSLFQGEFVAARFILRNTSNSEKNLSVALNLALGDLRLTVISTDKATVKVVRDVAVSCGERSSFKLKPDETIQWVGQVFYTNVGYTFPKPGLYEVSAELKVWDGTLSMVRSERQVVVVRSPSSQIEQYIAQLTLDTRPEIGVGRAFALGTFLGNTVTRHQLEWLAVNFGDIDTGRAAAFTLANNLSRPVHDLFDDAKEVRPAEPVRAAKYFRNAARSLWKDPMQIAVLAAGVASPTDANAPILDMAAKYLENPEFGDGSGSIVSAPVNPTVIATGAGDKDDSLIEAYSQAALLLAEWRRNF